MSLALICSHLNLNDLENLSLSSRIIPLNKNNELWKHKIQKKITTNGIFFLISPDGYYEFYKKPKHQLKTRVENLFDFIAKGQKLNSEEMFNAVLLGNYEIVKYLHRKGMPLKSSDLLEIASNNDLKLFHYFVRNGVTANQKEINEIADRGAEIEMIKYFGDKGQLPEDGGDWINDVKIMKYLDGFGLQPSEYALDQGLNAAIQEGKLELLEYIEEIIENKDYEIYTWDWSLNEAIKNGHLDIVKHLVHSYDLPDEKALNQAIKYEHFEIVKYLIDIGMKPDLNSIAEAASRNHLKIVQYLVDNFYKQQIKIIEKAFANNHIEVAKYIANSKIKFSQEDTDRAKENGNFNMIEYLDLTNK